MSARTAVELAADLRAHAARLNAGADILDPPRKPKPKRRRRRKQRKVEATVKDDVEQALEQVERAGNSLAAMREGARRAGVTLELGTRGRTSHPSDPDAEAIAEALAHTTEEPAPRR